MIRDDLSNKLIHFTKGIFEEATRRIHSMLSQKKLIGGTGSIEGGFRCVCFTESPIAKFSYILAKPKLFEFPYAPLGIMVDKVWLYKQGGRPVIYQSEKEYHLLHDSQKYRHKNYDPLQGIDFTWEREWRIKMDELPLDPAETTIVVPKRAWVEHFKMLYNDAIRDEILTFNNPPYFMIKSFPWHFIALEDLGVRVDWG